jgi:lysophospholipid acyltransferase (LPLAT)-like uncharacterized protein
VKRSERHYSVAGWLGSALLRSLGWTLRFRLEGREAVDRFRGSGQPVIFVFWHAWILPLALLHRGEGAVVLVSTHGDGEYIARVIGRMGFGTERGSSTRQGAVGLRGVVRALRGGRDVALTPDGPRGPAGVFKPGALLAAKLTGAPVVPVAVDGSPLWRLSSWDRFVVPRPGARIRVRYGEALTLQRDATEAELTAVARTLERELSVFDADSAGSGPGRADGVRS